MNYKQLNKAQLIGRIQELEAQSLEARAERFVQEVKLLAEDLMKSIEYVFNLGADTRRAVYSLSPMKANNHRTC